MDRTAFKERLKQYKQAKEQNKQKKKNIVHQLLLFQKDLDLKLMDFIKQDQDQVMVKSLDIIKYISKLIMVILNLKV